MNIRFENLTKDNYKDLHKIDLECFRDEVWGENTFFSDITDSFKTYEIADVDGVIAGYGCYTQILDECDILKVAVKPEFRKNGIGLNIMNRLLYNAREAGVTAVTLEVRESNVAAQKLYEKLGFKYVGTRKGFYRDKENAKIYWLYF